jgi:signal transduction histidine kinase
VASTHQKENYTTLIFQDFGIGIDLNRNRDKVFGLYQRFHNYPDSKGLGLYLVKSQVEAMGGTISIESEVDKGTTFTLIFKNK